jgi:hypothetical protein
LSWRIAGKWGKYFIWYQGNKKNTAITVFFGVLFYICTKGQMKPLNVLLRMIIERERTENEKGIEGRRGIFGKRFRMK